MDREIGFEPLNPLVSGTISETSCNVIHRPFRNPSANNELEDGAIQSFTLFENGTLSDALSSTKTGGSTPAHVFSSPAGVVTAMNVSRLRFCTVTPDLTDQRLISSLEEMASSCIRRTMGLISGTPLSSPSLLAPVVLQTLTKLSSSGTSCLFQTSWVRRNPDLG